MFNLFDRDFFKFFTGFIFILIASFGILYMVGTYSNSIDKQAAVMGK